MKWIKIIIFLLLVDAMLFGVAYLMSFRRSTRMGDEALFNLELTPVKAGIFVIVVNLLIVIGLFKEHSKKSNNTD